MESNITILIQASKLSVIILSILIELMKKKNFKHIKSKVILYIKNSPENTFQSTFTIMGSLIESKLLIYIEEIHHISDVE